MSFKEKILNRSNSYVYYKNSYESQKESHEKLTKKLIQLNDDKEFYKMHFDFVGKELNEKRDDINVLLKEKNNLIIENNYLKSKIDIYYDELINLNNFLRNISKNSFEINNFEEFGLFTKLFNFYNIINKLNQDERKVHKYDLAKIHIKNYGKFDNTIEILENSDSNSIVSFPKWFSDYEGKGLVIESYSGNLDFKLKIINDGHLNLSLRSLELKDENNKKIPLWIDYTSLIINGITYLDNHNLYWHDKPFIFEKEVCDSEIIDVHLKWVIYDRSTFEDNWNKYDIYQKIRNNLLALDIHYNELKIMPRKLYDFYINVLNNNNYDDFINFNRNLKSNYNFINKKKLQIDFDNYDGIGINTQKRDQSIIVSLTSFPERMEDIHFCLYSLLNQNFKPDKIILWLANEQFPNKEYDIPEDVLKLKENGLTIKWCKDIKSYKKLIFCLKEYPNDFIVTVDDDIYYPEDWLANIWNSYLENPNNIISSRLRTISLDSNNNFLNYAQWNLSDNFKKPSFLNFPTGAGGTMYFPGALSDKVFDEFKFMKLCPTADDIWFWAMAILNNTKITGVTNPYNCLTYVNIAREVGIIDNYTLWNLNKSGKNDEQIKSILNDFPEILEIINNNLESEFS